ncbi:rhomboid family intramembrane serine protease [Alienimonas chondri]|uniref:Peptidase S54 rhomboid domain-containing protein n=1 Tax=Alienimonas chondri TaxID=2681879 RepID=A0ABX1VDQ8_9PLAN|nr:rhomboid family intramembrane serine protease [Alienimonas chondri]NNJ25655.1 hypothetical protein [Alienimonas chondri]
MFIPVGTDAPIYHIPVVTILLAIANVAVHIALGQIAPDDWDRLSSLKLDYALWFGEGIHPLQWLTSPFLHRGWIELIANVIFLGAFGIIVEGKLGWWRFLLLYLAIAATAAGVEQTLLLGGRLTDPPRAEMEALMLARGDEPEEIDAALDFISYQDHAVAMGASAAIFGLVAISMVWAPRNEINVFWLIWRIGGIAEVPILSFALLYIGFEFVALAIQSSLLGWEYAVSNALMNVIGAAVGAGAGVLLLKNNWVDCENWDLFAVLSNTHGNQDEFDLRRSDYQRELTVPTQTAVGATGVQSGDDLSHGSHVAVPRRSGRGPTKKKPRRQADVFARLRKHLDAGDGISALGEWETLVGGRPKLVPPEPDLFALAEAVDQANFPQEAGDLFALYLRSYAKPKPDAAPPAEGEEPPAYDAEHNSVIRLRAARRLLERPGRRGQAATLLKGVDAAAISPKRRKLLEKLTAMATG